MSFGSGGGFGFGQPNTSTGFGSGGFGATNTGTPGFGANTGPAFGATNTATGGGLFGSTTGATGGGFGATTGAFGQPQNTTSAFGAKPAFGSSTTLFGGSSTAPATGTSAFGGFGGTSNTATASPFGSGGTSLFGANKPTGFGAATTGNTTGSTLFGGGSATGGAFGSTTGAFGATANPGIGTNIGEAPGTQTVPFQATVEKELNSATAQNSFQNVLFMDAYKKWSADELRLADYNQGRRHGNATGTGAFGVGAFGGGGFSATSNTTSAFGGGSTGTGLFGANANAQPTTSAFGQPAATGGFGATNTGGSLFGQKPAGGLFGSTTGQQPAAQPGSLFGTGGGFGNTLNTTGGFGAAANTATTGGGVFGANANAPKPGGGFTFGGGTGTTGGFGTTGTTGAFGTNTATTATGGGLGFGANTAQQAPAGGTLFGQPQNTTTGAFGGGFGTQAQPQAGASLFGATQPKPSLFGTTTAAAPAQGGGLFGSTNQGTSAFGTAQTNQTGGGLFNSKPAATGGGLFGGSTLGGANTGGGLFGGLTANSQAQQQQPAQGGSLFGSTLGSNQPKSLFGASAQGTGGSIFGGASQPQQGGSIFGSAPQPQPQGVLGGGFGASQPQAGQPTYRSSLSDMSAFGSGSLFAGAANNEVQNPGPLATPLSSTKKTPARAAILPIYKLNKPSTPKRGFGFSYSTYGTPTTPSSVNSTPGGFGQSLLAGSISRGLSKSISTSNLRRSYTVEDSILAPGAFSSSAGPRNLGGPSSVKKLVINRDIRSDLFSTPTKNSPQPADGVGSGARKAGKRVSFDPSTAAAIELGAGDGGEASNANGSANGAVREPGFLRPSSRNGANGAGAKPATPVAATPEMEQVKGNELAIVHEEESPGPTPRSSDGQRDLDAGDYWMEPSKEAIQNMNRVQRQKVANFTVGRENIGHVRFRVPVDLSNIDLDEICEGLVSLRPRSCTVYPNPARKPTMGKGLNVPAEITLEQSWPRGRDKSGSRYTKHVERLKRIPDTQFVSYNPDTGVWVFTVEHFTTYGLDDDDEDDDDEYAGQTGESSGPRATTRAVVPSQPRRQDQMAASPEVDPDDTFDFMRPPRRTVPGAFDSTDDALVEDEVQDYRALVRPPSPTGFSDSARYGDHAADNLQDQADLEMTVEHDFDSPEIGMAVDADHAPAPAVQMPPNPIAPVDAPAAGIMRARMRALKESTAPASVEITGGDDWTDMLRKSVTSGQQRDRATLRTLQESTVEIAAARGVKKNNNAWEAGVARRVVSDGRGFATSIDLMNSLFGRDKPAVDQGAAIAPPAKSFIKWPYQKQHQDLSEIISVDPSYRQFHASFKPRWGPGSTLLVSNAPGQKRLAQVPPQTNTGLATSSNEIWTVKLSGSQPARQPGSDSPSSQGIRHSSWITTRPVPGKVPEIVQPDRMPSLKEISLEVTGSSASSAHERVVWSLASILFDPVVGADDGRCRRANLSDFWQTLVEEQTSKAVSEASRNEDKAFACLAGRRIVDACKNLADARLYKLATLVPLIGSSDQAKEDMAEQMEEWYDGDVLSEIETPIRAIYSLLAGDVSVCKGKTGAGNENRLHTIRLASHFGLDWKQAFGLRLWYGLSAATSGDGISAAVRAFVEDIERGLVPFPAPWHQSDATQGGEDKENGQEEPQDILWGLLKLYAGQATLDEVLQPENCSPSRTDYSLCWQLGQILSAAGATTISRKSQPKADALTVSYGAQLMSTSAWSDAVSVLLHLSDRSTRARAVQDVVARMALEYASPTVSSPPTLTPSQGVRQLLDLESRHHIPKPWIAEACALAYRYLGGQVDCTHPANFHLVMKEVRCLALADRPQELQAAVVRRLDPLAVLQWPPRGGNASSNTSLGLLVEYLRARPVEDGLADIVTLATKTAGGGSAPQFDFDRYASMLRKRYEDAAGDDVVTLAALTSLMHFVQDRKRMAVAAYQLAAPWG